MIKFLLGAILAVLVWMHHHGIAHQGSPAKLTVMRYQIDSFHKALDSFKQDTGRYPTTAEGLQALRPYLQQDIPTDPWNQPYKYRLHPAGYPIVN
jgi:general secretion pathway protein G